MTTLGFLDAERFLYARPYAPGARATLAAGLTLLSSPLANAGGGPLRFEISIRPMSALGHWRPLMRHPPTQHVRFAPRATFTQMKM
jgi:hypothetical protein